MSTDQRMSPDERVLRDHLVRGGFRNGVERDRWRVIEIEWPFVIIAVAAALRDKAPAEYALRFECSNYPQQPPTAGPWDAENKMPLPAGHWPAGKVRVPASFNPGWNANALYLPCDRFAVPGHDAWRAQHPEMLWTPDKDITHYLRIVHELLNSSDYTGVRSP